MIKQGQGQVGQFREESGGEIREFGEVARREEEGENVIGWVEEG
jgi:hypothetical protein